MKIITYITLYVLLTVYYYLLLSSIGMLFGYTFKECYSNNSWFIIYMILFHWWMVILSLMEYYRKHIEKFF